MVRLERPLSQIFHHMIKHVHVQIYAERVKCVFLFFFILTSSLSSLDFVWSMFRSKCYQYACAPFSHVHLYVVHRKTWRSYILVIFVCRSFYEDCIFQWKLCSFCWRRNNSDDDDGDLQLWKKAHIKQWTHRTPVIMSTSLLYNFDNNMELCIKITYEWGYVLACPSINIPSINWLLCVLSLTESIVATRWNKQYFTRSATN